VFVTLTATDPNGRASLSVAGPGLSEEKCATHPERTQFDRVIVGLSRQLRTPLDYDPVAGRYTIAISTVPDEPEAATKKI
jgi:hypothetical protein